MIAVIHSICTFVGFAVIVSVGLTALVAAALWVLLRVAKDGRETED